MHIEHTVVIFIKGAVFGNFLLTKQLIHVLIIYRVVKVV